MFAEKQKLVADFETMVPDMEVVLHLLLQHLQWLLQKLPQKPQLQRLQHRLRKLLLPRTCLGCALDLLSKRPCTRRSRARGYTSDTYLQQNQDSGSGTNINRVYKESARIPARLSIKAKDKFVK